MIVDVAGSQFPVECANVDGPIGRRDEPLPSVVGGHELWAAWWIGHPFGHRFHKLNAAAVGANVRRGGAMATRGALVVVVLEQRQQDDQHDEEEYHRDGYAGGSTPAARTPAGAVEDGNVADGDLVVSWWAFV